MVETLQTILDQGKPTVIKGINYLSAKSYIQPFVDRLTPLNVEFICHVKVADQLSVTDQCQDVVFNRVHIQAVFPQEYYYQNECRKVMGMIYGLDTKKAVAKFYIGDIDNNGNLIAFDNNALRVQEIEDSTPLNYNPIQELLELTDINATMLTQIKDISIDKDTVSHKLGEWIDYTLSGCYISDFGKIKLATSVPINAYKSLVKDKDSEHYTEDDPSLLDIYKACLSILTEEDDLINKFEKTLLINKMLEL